MEDVAHASRLGEPTTAGLRTVSDRPARHCVVVSVLVLALAAPQLWAARSGAAKSGAMWVAAPVVAAPLAADPQVARPTESLGDCDFLQRFLIANEIVIHSNQRVAISRLGGLYGP